MKPYKKEVSAGIALIHFETGQIKILLIRVRKEGFELPKGHVEVGESLKEAAKRELQEETALRSIPSIEESIGTLEYTFSGSQGLIQKQVHYFLAVTEKIVLGKKPKQTRELRWITEDELEKISLVSEDLRPILQKAFQKGIKIYPSP